MNCDVANLLDVVLQDWNADEIQKIMATWELQAREDQWPPVRAQSGHPWTVWLVMGGRGAGKTRTGAEWIRAIALGEPQLAIEPVGRIALIGETAAAVRDVMIEGVSGLLSVHGDDERPLWEPSRRRLSWRNGAIAQVFSAEDPESLRGPQFEFAWLDELAKWRYAQAAFDMLQFGLRLGHHPRQIVTTTPRSIALIRRLLNDPLTAVTKSKTQDNAKFLAPTFLNTIVARYEGSRLGRQELDGELIEDRHDALWSRQMLEDCRQDSSPPLRRIVVAVDPPASSHKRADKCGIIAAGLDQNGLIFVIADESLAAAKPGAWARKAIELYHRLEADELIAEVNQGGEMVAAVMSEADHTVPVRQVRATRGKYLRAAPVAQLYEQGRVRHVGFFTELEDEMCAFGPDGLKGQGSPDRMDALVWAIAALMDEPPNPRLRRI